MTNATSVILHPSEWGIWELTWKHSDIWHQSKLGQAWASRPLTCHHPCNLVWGKNSCISLANKQIQIHKYKYTNTNTNTVSVKIDNRPNICYIFGMVRVSSWYYHHPIIFILSSSYHHPITIPSSSYHHPVIIILSATYYHPIIILSATYYHPIIILSSSYY